MAFIGDLAVYVKTQKPESLRNFETRADFPRAVMEQSFPGLWDIFLAGGILAARCRRTLPAGAGYTGLIISSPYAESYGLLSSALLAGLQQPVEGAFGVVIPVRILTKAPNLPFLWALSLDCGIFPSPMEAPATLKTFTPLRRPFAIGREIRDAQSELAGLINRPELAPESGKYPWIITDMNMFESPEGGARGTVSVYSSHPFALLALKYAIIKGFGSMRDKGCGNLDLDPGRRYRK